MSQQEQSKEDLQRKKRSAEVTNAPYAQQMRTFGDFREAVEKRLRLEDAGRLGEAGREAAGIPKLTDSQLIKIARAAPSLGAAGKAKQELDAMGTALRAIDITSTEVPWRLAVSEEHRKQPVEAKLS